MLRLQISLERRRLRLQLPPRCADDGDYQQILRLAESGEPALAPPKADGLEKQPAVEMTGIGSSLAVDRFVGAAKQVQKCWPSLKIGERAQGLATAANAELKRVEVPEVSARLEAMADAGRLHFNEWTLGLGKTPFSQAAVTDAEAADIADTVYHESRHAEQWHRMARLLAGRGKKSAEIGKETGIPESIAAHAAARPLDGGDGGGGCSREGSEARSFYDSVYGAKRDQRNRVLRDLSARGELRDKAESACDTIDSDENATAEQKKAARDAWRKAYDDWKKAFDLYMALPEEADAWKAGGAVTTRYLQK